MSFSCESPLFCVDIWSFIVTTVLKFGERQFLTCRTDVIFPRFSGVRESAAKSAWSARQPRPAPLHVSRAPRPLRASIVRLKNAKNK